MPSSHSLQHWPAIGKFQPCFQARGHYISQQTQKISQCSFLKLLLEKKALVDFAHEGALHKGLRGNITYSARLDRAYAPYQSQWAPQLIPTEDSLISDHSSIRVGCKTNLPVWRPMMENTIQLFRTMVNDLIEDFPTSPTIKEWTARPMLPTLKDPLLPPSLRNSYNQPKALRQRLKQMQSWVHGWESPKGQELWMDINSPNSQLMLYSSTVH